MRACGLDVHKDSVFVCIITEEGEIFRERFGVLTPELEQMRKAYIRRCSLLSLSTRFEEMVVRHFMELVTQ